MRSAGVVDDAAALHAPPSGRLFGNCTSILTGSSSSRMCGVRMAISANTTRDLMPSDSSAMICKVCMGRVRGWQVQIENSVSARQIFMAVLLCQISRHQLLSHPRRLPAQANPAATATTTTASLRIHVHLPTCVWYSPVIPKRPSLLRTSLNSRSGINFWKYSSGVCGGNE